MLRQMIPKIPALFLTLHTGFSNLTKWKIEEPPLFVAMYLASSNESSKNFGEPTTEK